MHRRWNLDGIAAVATVAVVAMVATTWAMVLLVTPGVALAGGPAEANSTVTFTKDVLPILQRSCQKCHRPDTAAPMSLLTYDDARPWARSIKARVVARQMPPWHLDRSIGEFEADPSLSDVEIATISAWADNGAPRGDPSDAPPPLALANLEQWTYGEPDLIVSMKDGFMIPAEGPDFYPSEVVDPGLAEDRYVKWVQIIPSAWCCVHHSHVYVSVPETAEDLEEFRLGMGSNTDEIDLIEYAMGSSGQYYPEGTGRKLPAGGLFRFAPHYHPWGKETRDIQRVGIKFYPKGEVPELIVTAHRLRTGVGNDWVFNREAIEDRLLRAGYDLDLHATDMPSDAWIDDNTLNGVALMSIPPDSVARHERFWPLPNPALILSFQPHMHFRGDRMLLEAIHLDGRREILIDVTKYEQSWQIVYPFKEPYLFPKGTILHSVTWHDNTTNNRHNPDPSAWIGWGGRTMDEMGHGWTDIAFMTDEQYQARRRARDSASERASEGP